MRIILLIVPLLASLVISIAYYRINKVKCIVFGAGNLAGVAMIVFAWLNFRLRMERNFQTDLEDYKAWIGAGTLACWASTSLMVYAYVQERNRGPNGRTGGP